MMSSSELQRVALATAKVVTPQGTIDVEPLKIIDSMPDDNDADKESIRESIDATSSSPTSGPSVSKRSATIATAASSSTKSMDVNVDHAGLTNGIGEGNSPNKANETITSSMGDITVDSVRDHLNSTTTTLCSTTTEETVGKCLCLSSTYW